LISIHIDVLHARLDVVISRDPSETYTRSTRDCRGTPDCPYRILRTT
jgi:hypothetical protein